MILDIDGVAGVIKLGIESAIDVCSGDKKVQLRESRRLLAFLRCVGRHVPERCFEP
jgi:hypothetical protein